LRLKLVNKKDKDIIKTMDNGILVPQKNHGAIAYAIKLISQDNILRKKLIKDGKITAQMYDWKQVSLNYLNIYQD
jgi:glycosyltransferase involved in cell wall biosynthesis